MAKVLVYDAYANKFYKYNLSENDPMPYSYGNTMRLREFRGSSGSQTLWTTVAAMEAWNLTRRRYGKGIYIGYAFKRIWEGGHGTTSQHYAGVSFDVGQNVSSAERVRIRDAAVATKAWGYVEPISMTPRWVHFDRRYGTAACSGVGYPTVRRNSRSTYVRLGTLPARWTAFSATIPKRPSRRFSVRWASRQTASAAAIPGKSLPAPWWALAAPKP